MKHLRLATAVASTLSFFAISSTVSADIGKSTARLCEKIKTCSMQAIDEQGLPPEMKETFSKEVDAQCESIASSYQMTSIEDAGLTNKAQACVNSIEQISCDKMMESEDSMRTSACTEFETAAEAAGIDLNQSAK